MGIGGSFEDIQCIAQMANLLFDVDLLWNIFWFKLLKSLEKVDQNKTCIVTLFNQRERERVGERDIHRKREKERERNREI